MTRLAIDVALFLAVVFWLALAFWVYRDARRRSAGYGRIGAATLLGLVPVVGPLGYVLVRPPETRADAHGRRVEIAALESWLARKTPECPTCRAAVEPAFLVCPVCTTRLKEPCGGCGTPLERSWLACPHCARSASEPAALDLDAALTQEAVVHGIGARPKQSRPRKEQRAAS